MRAIIETPLGDDRDWEKIFIWIDESGDKVAPSILSKLYMNAVEQDRLDVLRHLEMTAPIKLHEKMVGYALEKGSETAAAYLYERALERDPLTAKAALNSFFLRFVKANGGHGIDRALRTGASIDGAIRDKNRCRLSRAVPANRWRI